MLYLNEKSYHVLHTEINNCRCYSFCLFLDCLWVCPTVTTVSPIWKALSVPETVVLWSKIAQTWIKDHPLLANHLAFWNAHDLTQIWVSIMSNLTGEISSHCALDQSYIALYGFALDHTIADLIFWHSHLDGNSMCMCLRFCWALYRERCCVFELALSCL